MIAPDDRTILVARAAELARQTISQSAGELLNLVSFRVGSDVFAIESRFVREVVRLRQFTVVPGAPTVVRGVTTYQGEILALIDLPSALGIEGERLRDALWVLVVGENGAEFGITADELRGSLEVGVDSLLPASAVAGRQTRYVRATTADAIAVLDGAVLLASDDLFGGSPGARVAMRSDHESGTQQKESVT